MYYKLNAKTSKVIMPMLLDWKDKLEQAHDIADEIGAGDLVIDTHNLRVLGFVFDEDATPDAKVFKKCKYIHNGYLPKSRTALKNRIEPLHAVKLFDKIFDLVGIPERFIDHNGDLLILRCGLKVKGKYVYVQLPDGSPEPDATKCKRISDLVFENIVSDF